MTGERDHAVMASVYCGELSRRRTDRLTNVAAFQDLHEARQNMLKLRSIGLSDDAVLEGRQRIGRIRFVIELMDSDIPEPDARHDRQTPRGVIEGPRHGQGGVQGGLGTSQGQDDAGTARGGLPRDEHPRRRLTRIPAACA
jgi:hypothetical protein